MPKSTTQPESAPRTPHPVVDNIPHRIEVGFKDGVKDPHGEKIRRMVASELSLSVHSVRTVEVYTLDMELTGSELKLLASGPFSDPVVQNYSIDSPLTDDFDWLVEVGLKPGVTDNVGRTALEAALFCIGRECPGGGKIYASRQYLFKGRLSRDDLQIAVDRLLANELIHCCEIVHRDFFDSKKGLKIVIPKVRGADNIEVEEIDLNVPEKMLLKISRERLLALGIDEMMAVKSNFNSPEIIAERKACGLSSLVTDVELEVLAQTWSEHCKHKIFNADIEYTDEKGRCRIINSLFDTYIKASTETIRKRLGERDWCVSVFKDNAGIIAWDEMNNLVFKVETHNSPSALDPYGGALTGIVGVNRDTLGTGKGAKLIFNTDVFCFASPFYNKALPPRILHPARIFEGVREGVEHGGNKSGIPTVNGSMVFDDRFLGKPLVYCGTGGIIPKKILGEPSEEKTARPGDCIVMTGGRIGKDGIHGATFSSEEFHEGSPVTAVQIGDPITQKRMSDFILEARDRGLYNCITDNGAGGLSSSVGEMALSSNGCEINLEDAPLKYSGLQPWEILLSEAQERMTFAVDPGSINDFLQLACEMGVEATTLGKFTDSGFFHVCYEGKTVAYLSMDFLHNGLPTMKLKAKWRSPLQDNPDFAEPEDLTGVLKKMLSRLNICSKEFVVRQYDHEVQGGSVVKPLCGLNNDGPSDAAVLRPVLESMKGVVVSHGICPRYSDIDAYHMMACAIDEALRNYLCVGGSLEGVAGLDNFCWCDPVASEKNPDGEYKLAQLVRANMALFDYTTAFSIPCISGKDSMKNDYVIGGHRISIPPTVLFSIIGRADDVRKAQTMDAKNAEDIVFLLGQTRDELGGSEYYAMSGFTGNSVPNVNAGEALKLYRALSTAIHRGLLKSCHDCSDGGLGVALAETAFSGGFGMEVDLRRVPVDGLDRNDSILFSETQSRFVVTVSPENKADFEKCMDGNIFAEIGIMLEKPVFLVNGLNAEIVVNADIGSLKEAWQRTLG